MRELHNSSCSEPSFLKSLLLLLSRAAVGCRCIDPQVCAAFRGANGYACNDVHLLDYGSRELVVGYEGAFVRHLELKGGKSSNEGLREANCSTEEVNVGVGDYEAREVVDMLVVRNLRELVVQRSNKSECVDSREVG